MSAIDKATVSEARARASRIRAGIASYLSTLADVAAAYRDRDWIALGYEDWSAYIEGEYSAERLRLTPEHRQKAVEELRLAGLSQRAIGTALGVSQSTVRDDLAELSTSTQLPDHVTGIDGAQRPSSNPRPAARTAAQPEAYGRLPQPGAGSHTAAEATGFSADGPAIDGSSVTVAGPAGGADFPAAPPVTPLDDPFQIREQQRIESSVDVAGALVTLLLRLDPDPVRWLENTWIPDAYRNRDLPRVRDAFTVAGLHTIAKHIETLAYHIDRDGEGEL